MPSQPLWFPHRGCFVSWQPLPTPSLDFSVVIPVVLGAFKDGGNGAAEVAGERLTLVLSKRRLVARMSDQIRKLQSSDIVALGFNLQLTAGEMSHEFLPRQIVRPSVVNPLERVFQAAVFLSAS
jgi:hypothetical protein